MITARAERLVHELEGTAPGSVELATRASLAVRAEPELLRVLRLSLVPRLGVAAESDLWFSPLVRSRGPDGIVLFPEISALLRERLRERPEDLRRAWAAMERLHQGISWALHLEERVAWLAASQEDPRLAIEEALAPAVAAVVGQGRTGLARWASRALPRMPAAAWSTKSAWVLAQAAAGSTRHSSETGVPQVDLGVRREGGDLVLGDEDGPVIQVPNTDPRLVEVRWSGDGGSQSRLMGLPAGTTLRLQVGRGAVRLRTASGAMYELAAEPFVDLMQEPEVRDAVVALGIHLERLSLRISLINGYMSVHDLLHTLRLQVYEPILLEAKRFPDDELAVENLRVHEAELRYTIANLRVIEGQAFLPSGELAWIQRDLEPARESLNAALEMLEPKSLQRAVSLLKRVLTIRPSEINTRLNDAARALPFPDLIQLLIGVLERMRNLDLDQELVQQFASSIDALTRLSRDLAVVVTDHDRWQEAEQELWLMEETWGGTVEEIEDSWSRIRRTLEPMMESPELWATSLRQDVQQMEAALGAKDLQRARRIFRKFHRQVSRRFYQVSLMLKELCDELRRMTEPLTLLLRRIES